MDSMKERVFVPALHGFVDTIRERKPTTPIILISPIFCPSAEHHPGPTVPNSDGKFVTLSGHPELRQWFHVPRAGSGLNRGNCRAAR
ncbi:MAG: hypothetical protein CM1200mP9_03350 [Gammaproteobacteria bacterium]|nr:MAG: hypothetical protein CM1200mP9_03350 [Gammaproteobacteria bacterium]